MAINVSIDDVRKIFPTPMSEAELQAFLDVAVRLIEEQLGSKGLSAERLTDITVFMTAHLGSTVTPSTLRERVGRDYEMWRTGLFGEGLHATTYGQQVLLLDTTGTLQSAGKKQKITFKVVGRPES